MYRLREIGSARRFSEGPRRFLICSDAQVLAIADLHAKVQTVGDLLQGLQCTVYLTGIDDPIPCQADLSLEPVCAAIHACKPARRPCRPDQPTRLLQPSTP